MQHSPQKSNFSVVYFFKEFLFLKGYLKELKHSIDFLLYILAYLPFMCQALVVNTLGLLSLIFLVLAIVP